MLPDAVCERALEVQAGAGKLEKKGESLGYWNYNRMDVNEIEAVNDLASGR